MNLTAIQDVLNQEFASPIADQLNNIVPIVRHIPKVLGSGKNIAWTARVASDHKAGSYADGATMNQGAAATNTRLPAILQWKAVKAEFSVTGLSMAVAANSKPEDLADLFADELQAACLDLCKSLGTQLYGDGTGNTGLDLDGLLAGIAASGSYAGIDRGTYSAWRSIVKANAGVPRALTKALMDGAEADIFTATNGVALVNLIITTPAIYTKFEQLFDSTVRTNDQETSRNLGANHVTYKQIPVIRDARCPAGHMFMLSIDPSSIRLVQLPPLGMSDGMELVQGYMPLHDGNGNLGLQVGIELLGKTGDKVDGFLKIYSNLQVRNPNRFAVIKDIDEA